MRVSWKEVLYIPENYHIEDTIDSKIETTVYHKGEVISTDRSTLGDYFFLVKCDDNEFREVKVAECKLITYNGG